MAMPDSQKYPRYLYLTSNVKDIVIFLGLNAVTSDNSYLFSNSKNAQVTFVEKRQFFIMSFQSCNNCYLLT